MSSSELEGRLRVGLRRIAGGDHGDRQGPVIAQGRIVRAADPVDDLVGAVVAGIRRVDDRPDPRGAVGGPRDDRDVAGIADVVGLDIHLDGPAVGGDAGVVVHGDRVDRDGHRPGVAGGWSVVVAALDRERVRPVYVPAGV